MNKVYDKNKNLVYEEKVNKFLTFFYSTIIGRILLKIIVTKFITNIGSFFMNSKLSKIKINKFIKKNNIDMSEYKTKNYKSFNDFFIRNIKSNKRKIIDDKNLFISPSDSKLFIYKIDSNECIKIKNSKYTVSELIDEEVDSKFNNGYALVFRLSVDDYHHYIYIDDGYTISNKKISGKFHTVNPLALKKYKVYSENSREVTKIHTLNFGDIVYIEVGALMVGRIVNLNKKTFKKGDEKGYFCFGGSTIVILLKKDTIKLDEKIMYYCNKDIEVKLKLGDIIGRRKGK